MVDVNVNFVLGNDEPLRADFELQPDVTYTADIKLSEATRDHTKLYNRDRANQHPMSAITGLEDALDGLSDDIIAENNRAIEAEEALDNKIDLEADTRADEITRVEGLISDEETRAKGVEQDLASSIDSNHQAISNHVSDKNNPHEVTKTQVGLGNVENLAPADMPVSTATQTALNTKVDKVSTADRVYGTDAQGNQTTYDKGSFGQVDDVRVGGVSVVTNKIANLGTMAGETASDYYTSAQVDTALSDKQDTISDLSTIRSNATQGKSAYDTIQTYGNIVTHNVSEFATSAQGALADTALQPNDNISELTNNLSYQTATQVANSIAVETNNRELADNSLQSQIDAIVSASDVFDIVGTYAELQAYDISTVPVNDIIKVLVDNTHAGAATYYRCIETNNVKSWSYIGSEGAYYTKGEADNKFVPQTRTVNNKALSSDITLTAGDVGALPSSTVIPTVNDSTVTIQKNGSTVSTFTLNQSSNETVNITVPTDTSDLTNNAGFITGITSGDVTTALGYTPYDSTNPNRYISGVDWGNITGDIEDQTDLKNALDEKQDTLSGGRYIEIVSGGTLATLPAGCKQVEYITATGTQHLDTLITATNDYEIRAKFRINELNDSFLYGARQAYGSSSFALHKNYAQFSTDVGTGYVNLGVDSWYSVRQNKNGIYVNNSWAHAYNNSLASFTTPNTIRVFAMAQGNNAMYGSTFMKGDFASFEVYNNGVLVCNLVPCIDSNDVACMYDTVNERFLYNSGTGSFTAGAEVVPSNTVNCTLTGSDISTLLGYTPASPSDIGNATITLTQGGVTKGSFTLNQSSSDTIAFDAGGSGGIQNTATGTDSLTILGNATSSDSSVNIGDYTSATGDYAVAIGGQSGDAYYAEASGYGTSVGAGAGASSGSVAVGYQAQTEGSDNIAVGRDTYIDSDASSSVAIGNGASVTGEGNTIANSIQLGSGTNSTANSLQVGSYQLLDTSTGLIPDARISTNIARTADVVSTSDLATCHVVIETYHSGVNWYRVYDDKWCEQGGQISNLSTTGVTISLHKHFIDTNYSISTTQYVNNATGQFAYIRNAPTTSSIDIKANSGTIDKLYWEAKGYIA